MAITEPFVDTGATIGVTEYDLPSDTTSLSSQTDDGVYQAFIELHNLAKGDVFEFRVAEKVYGAATQRTVFTVRFSNAQSEPVWVSPSLILLHGWTMTLKKIAGTDRSIAWSIRKIA